MNSLEFVSKICFDDEKINTYTIVKWNKKGEK